MRTAATGLIALAGIALLGASIPGARASWQASHAILAICDNAVQSLRPSTWIRLRDCGADMFHGGILKSRDGRIAYRVAPLREPWASADEPSRLALAVAIDDGGTPPVVHLTPRPDVARSKVADLGDTLAVVAGRIDRARFTPVMGIEPMLASDALVLEARDAPSASRWQLPIAAALGCLALAGLLALWRPRPRDRGVAAPVPPPRRPVRWGLVFAATLVGTIALFQWLGWYFDPVRQATSAALRPSTPSPAMAAAPAESTLPPPTREEIALLESSDPANRLRAADTLLARASTAEVERAVELALGRGAAPDFEARLVCLKARVAGPGTLDFLLARFPADRLALDWTLKPDVACVLDALVRRAPEAPERICAALVPAVYASNAATRAKVLAAFRTVDLPEVPAQLLADATRFSGLQADALQAVIALDGVRRYPDVIASAWTSRSTVSAVVEHELSVNPHPNAARIVANAWIDGSATGRFEQLALRRETSMHDVSAALLETVSNPDAPVARRRAAARELGVLGEVGALRDLRALSDTLEQGALKSVVDATIEGLALKQRTGARAALRLLPPLEPVR